MAARFPLIANSSSNQIQELASGDDMDLTGNSITGAGISTIDTTRTMVLGVRTGTAVTFSISGGSFNVSGRAGNVAIDV